MRPYRFIPLDQPSTPRSKGWVRSVFKWTLFVVCWALIGAVCPLGLILAPVFLLATMGYYKGASPGPRRLQRQYYVARYGGRPERPTEPVDDNPYAGL